MIPSSCFNEKGQFAWDSTSATYAMDCLWKYKATMIEGWRGKLQSVHLIWGGWFASGVERYHRLRAEGRDYDAAVHEVVKLAMLETWDSEADKPWDGMHNTKTRENLIRTLVWYFEEYKDDPLKTVILSDGRPAVEYSFSLELAPGIIWAGHLDRLVDYNGDIFVQDQKTTQSTIGTYWFDQFDPDVQMTGYTFAGRAVYKSPIKGVILDGAQVAVGFSRFVRGFTWRTDAQLEEWRKDTIYWIEQAQRAFQSNHYPRNRASCSKYGGCVFRSVCSRSPEVREAFLKADFEQQKPWNPLEKR